MPGFSPDVAPAWSGQRFAVDNRPSASAIVGTDVAAKRAHGAIDHALFVSMRL